MISTFNQTLTGINLMVYDGIKNNNLLFLFDEHYVVISDWEFYNPQ